MNLHPDDLQAIAEQRATYMPTLRPTVHDLEKALFQPIPILDHGFVRIIDYMGNDEAIVQAARTSYGKGTKSALSSENLIRYLLRHWHTTPFEMCEIKLHFKVPMFVGEQMLRQRAASVNKESGRYSIMSDDKYLPTPERLAHQSKTNKQGSGAGYTTAEAEAILAHMRSVHDEIQRVYGGFVSEETDLARELARGILPANQYATFYWKIDLHNLLNFLRQRTDDHAQYEIRVYAKAIEQIVKVWVPFTYQAFLDYRKNAVTFSGPEMLLLADLIDQEKLRKLIENQDEIQGLGLREISEFFQKF